MLYFFHMLSLSKPHIVISTERPRAEKTSSTPRGTFRAGFVPSAVLQHVARHVLGPLCSLSRAGGRGEGKGEGDQGFSCVRCRALLFAISDHWSPIGDNMGRFCAQAVPWWPAHVVWRPKIGLCRLLGPSTSSATGPPPYNINLYTFVSRFSKPSET